MLADDRVRRVGQPELLQAARRASPCGRSVTSVSGKKPSSTTASSVARSSFAATVFATRPEPRDGTAMGASVERRVVRTIAPWRGSRAWIRARNCHASMVLPAVSSLRLQGVGQREIHVVAAEQDVLADADALELELAGLFSDGDEAEVGGAAADVADQDDIARATCLRQSLPACAVHA